VSSYPVKIHIQIKCDFVSSGHCIFRSCRKVLYILVTTISLEQRDASGVHSKRCPMHATIDVRLTVSIDDDKTLPLATLAEFVTDQNVESVLLEGFVESLDAACVEALCGEKHAHGNGEQRFQHRGTDTRTAVTTAGDHEFNLHYVEDTDADHDESSYFRPVEVVLSFDGQNRYKQDIATNSVDIATLLSVASSVVSLVSRLHWIELT